MNKNDLINRLLVLTRTKEAFQRSTKETICLLRETGMGVDLDMDRIEKIFNDEANLDEMMLHVASIWHNNMSEEELRALCNFYTEYPEIAEKQLSIATQAMKAGSQLGEEWVNTQY